MGIRWTDKPSAPGITGGRIEQQALKWLKQQGLSLVAKNYRCKAGEIDLVMSDAELLVFVEVRFRAQLGFGSAVESVDWRKQNKLIRAANHFLISTPKHHHRPCRFDVLALQPSDHSGKLCWQWIKNAFTS